MRGFVLLAGLVTGLAACGGGGGPAAAVEVVASVPRPSVAPEERVIYFVLTDRFANGDSSNDGDSDSSQLLAWHGGDFRGLTERIPYLAELGVTTIWISPIVDQIDAPVEGGGLPHWGYHGYWAEHFDRIDPHLGTEADLSALLEAAHRVGLEVILDVVLNHPGYGSHFVTDGGWVRACAEPGPDAPHDDLTQCLFGLPDFLTEDASVAQQLIAWQTDWFARFAFDGLRADTVKHVETSVWRDYLASVRALEPDSFFALGESWGTAPGADEPLLAPGLFDAMYDFGFADLVEGWLNERMRSAALAHHLGTRNDVALGRYVHYLDTHDVPTMVWRLERAEAYPLALVLLLTSGGIPLLYYGDEVGRPGGEWPNNRPDMPWSRVASPDATPLALVRSLLATRRQRPALTHGSYAELASDAGLVVFAREHGADRVVVALNRGPEDGSVSCDGLSCEPLVCWNCVPGEGSIALPAWSAVVLGR